MPTSNATLPKVMSDVVFGIQGVFGCHNRHYEHPMIHDEALY